MITLEYKEGTALSRRCYTILADTSWSSMEYPDGLKLKKAWITTRTPVQTDYIKVNYV